VVAAGEDHAITGRSFTIFIIIFCRCHLLLLNIYQCHAAKINVIQCPILLSCTKALLTAVLEYASKFQRSERSMGKRSRKQKDKKVPNKNMYKDQIHRLDRMFKLITQDESFQSLDGALQRDIILSFFLHCWHLADWLARTVVDEDKVFGYALGVYELQVCRNLITLTKHLDIWNPSPPKLFDHEMKEFTPPYSIYRGYDPIDKSAYWVIHVDGNILRCSEFMERCVQKWNIFLDQEGLERLKSI
jgi:hypothetical protein